VRREQSREQSQNGRGAAAAQPPLNWKCLGERRAFSFSSSSSHPQQPAPSSVTPSLSLLPPSSQCQSQFNPLWPTIAMINYSLPASKRRRQPLAIALLLLIALWSWHSTRSVKATHNEGFYPERYPLAWKHVSLASTRGGGTSLNRPSPLSPLCVDVLDVVAHDKAECFIC
jgi:hypothetical protein